MGHSSITFLSIFNTRIILKSLQLRRRYELELIILVIIYINLFNLDNSISCLFTYLHLSFPNLLQWLWDRFDDKLKGHYLIWFEPKKSDQFYFFDLVNIQNIIEEKQEVP